MVIHDDLTHTLTCLDVWVMLGLRGQAGGGLKKNNPNTRTETFWGNVRQHCSPVYSQACVCLLPCCFVLSLLWWAAQWRLTGLTDGESLMFNIACWDKMIKIERKVLNFCHDCHHYTELCANQLLLWRFFWVLSKTCEVSPNSNTRIRERGKKTLDSTKPRRFLTFSLLWWSKSSQQVGGG